MSTTENIPVINKIPHPANTKPINTYLILLISLFVLSSLFVITSLPAAAGPSPQQMISETLSNPSNTPSPTASLPIGLSSSSLLTTTITLTPTLPTATDTVTSTPTTTVTATPTETQPPSLPMNVYIPVVISFYPIPTPTPTPTFTPTPTRTPTAIVVCRNLSQPLSIPDNNPNGVNSTLGVNDPGILIDLNLYLNISHSWVGDIKVSLAHQNTGHGITPLDRPGVPTSYVGCQYDNIITILDDEASQPVENKCASYPVAISGSYIPNAPLSTFVGETISGDWILNVADLNLNDTGSLNAWCLEATIGDGLPEPSPTPTPTALPSEAMIHGMTGKNQLFPLDCESRAAVDWAAHFGYHIDEVEFFNHLPSSDDPDTGFVGNVNGAWGQIPPHDYGVYAFPVASVLRGYGLTATAYRMIRWDDVRAEIAAGHPVIVWLIDGAINGIPVYYTAASNGHTTVVARYEHTINLIGYSPTSVTILDGASIYTRALNQFLDSWSALRNMAILYRP